VIYTLAFRRYAPFDTFGGGFEGDSRSSGSTSLLATARTTGLVSFAPGNVGAPSASSSGTSFKGAGARVERLLGKHQSKVTSSVTVTTRSAGCVRFTAQTSGSNPMVPLAPDIDTYIDLSVSFGKASLDVVGKVRGDDFPNAEVFLLDAKGGAVMLFEYATTGGQTTGPMTRLAGSHRQQSLGDFAVRLPIRASGAFVIASDVPF
jgi:hypothetical protein